MESGEKALTIRSWRLLTARSTKMGDEPGVTRQKHHAFDGATALPAVAP
jgi:hypothetical protein